MSNDSNGLAEAREVYRKRVKALISSRQANRPLTSHAPPVDSARKLASRCGVKTGTEVNIEYVSGDCPEGKPRHETKTRS
jgi:hypothetical protein